MFKNTKAFSGFSVNDLERAKEFYGQALGLEIEEIAAGLMLKIAGTNGVFVYPKEDHAPATFTILNFLVDDLAVAAEALKKKGVTFEQYPPMTDENGLAFGRESNMGPDIAWFKDPAGNILSILRD